MSQIRQLFILLNLEQDKEEERSAQIEAYWHQLRAGQAALHPDSKYEDFLKNLDEGNKDFGPSDELDKFKVWKWSNPEWIDFEISKDEEKVLFEQKLNARHLSRHASHTV